MTFIITWWTVSALLWILFVFAVLIIMLGGCISCFKFLPFLLVGIISMWISTIFLDANHTKTVFHIPTNKEKIQQLNEQYEKLTCNVEADNH